MVIVQENALILSPTSNIFLVPFLVEFFYVHVKFGLVTGSSIHTPDRGTVRQRNSTHEYTVRRYIYENRWLKHTHSPILQVQTINTWNRFMAPLHVILPDTTQPMSTSTATSTVPRGVMIITNRKRPADTPIVCSLPRLICRYEPHYWYRQFFIVQQFQFNSTQVFDGIILWVSQLDLTKGFWLDLTQVFPNRFDSRFLTVFDSVFWGLIQLMFNTFIFDLSHTIWVKYQSGFRSPTLSIWCLQIIQHWNFGIFRNY